MPRPPTRSSPHRIGDTREESAGHRPFVSLCAREAPTIAPMDAPSFDNDLEKREMRVYRRDGRQVVVALPAGLFGEATNIQRFGLRAADEQLFIASTDCYAGADRPPGRNGA